LSPEKEMARDRRSLWRAWWSVAYGTAETNFSHVEKSGKWFQISGKKIFTRAVVNGGSAIYGKSVLSAVIAVSGPVAI
jgi:hypothetical protein